MSRGFPNLFIVPAPGQQAVICANITLVSVEGAEHIAATIEQLDRRGVRVFDVSQQAEDEYVAQIVGAYRDTSPVMAACTPSRLNFEGNPEGINPRSGSWGGGMGDFWGYVKMLADWRERRRLRRAGSGSPGRGSLSTASPGVDERGGGMASTRGGSTQRVVVVTGGAAGIGAAIAEELGRNGTYVVTLDPMVTLDGSGRLE